MRGLILALSLALSTSAAASDLAWDTSKMARGASLVMQDASGVTSHIKRGREGGHDVFDMFAGQGRGAEYLGSYKVNGRGEVTATIAADGAVTTFSPSRCTRTVGECRFVVTHSNGFREPRTRVTQAVDGGLRFREYGLDGLMAEGALKLDQIGAAVSGWTKRDGGRKTKSRRIALALN